ncbi:magnesium transporter [Baia soyae]|uniref:Magnesium transporter MgtE n=1 Tax=Baia soyae TaxID=1544746 RepID=A0A4V2SX81_9BACL|nr:magnesium transporter [Baia soyae]TCP64926.1 magnesium transporter [Baia soyae]
MISLTELAELRSKLEMNDPDAIREILEELPPYDLRQFFFFIDEEQQKELLSYLSISKTAHLFEEMEHLDQKKQFMSLVPAALKSEIFREISSDDLADFLGEISQKEAETILTKLDQPEAENVRDLLHYPEDTAGGLMTTEYVHIMSEITASEAIDQLRRKAPDAETIYYLYVVDDSGHLLGVVSLRELLIAKPEVKIHDIMYERIISVPVDLDQEEVAKVFTRYDLLAVPVVDHNHYLRGIVTVDDVMDVLIEEAQEDFANFSGGGGDQGLFISPIQAVRKRIPWLILLLLIGLITANLINLFKPTTQKLPILLIFMPMIAGMTGNAATQSLATVIRFISNGELTKENYGKLLRQESTIAMLIGLFCSLFILGFISLSYDGRLGILVAVCLFFTLIIGTIVGTMIPMVLQAFKIDPTVASGPLITTINDVVSLMIYFGLATLFVQLISS